MNTLLSDLKAILTEYKNLNCLCDIVMIVKSRRVYNGTKNGALRVGQLIVDIDIKYSQSRLNPNLNVCI